MITKLKNLWDSIKQDLCITFKAKLDGTTLLHLIRDFLITFILAYVMMLSGYVIPLFRYIEIILSISVGASLGFNTAWEWQDGKKEGFDIIDFIAGIVGTTAAILLFIKLFVAI